MNKTLDHILLERYQVAHTAITDARTVCVQTGSGLGDVLINKKVLTEKQFLEALSSCYDLPLEENPDADPKLLDFTNKIPIGFLKRYKMVPIALEKQGLDLDDQNDSKAGTIVVAINDPSHFHAVDDLANLLNARATRVILAPGQAILSAINRAYDMTTGDSAEQLVADMEESTDSIMSEIELTADLLDDTSDAPIIKLVNHILSQGVKARASDIHIEPYQTSLKVRYRVDGIMYDLITPPKKIQSALISRIKVMGKMNIAEKRLPQDGRIEIRIGDKNVDIRVSTIPTSFGERLVMRLLDKSTTIFQLQDIGFSTGQMGIIDQLIRAPHGIILVTGPTGSGKTTTLYAVLSTINTPDVNIITIEDPVEYQIEGIGQIQVNPKIDLTFAKGLRSIVRQDPDVILVGEIRDQETAEIAVQSSLTGHLVFSTLHTNDSASAVTRLIDMGVEPFLISSSVLAVMAQRLVRRLCPSCKRAYKPDEMSLQSLGISSKDLAGHTVYEAVGCQDCLQTGYRGRVGIFEIMIMDKALKSLILSTSDSNQIKAQAVQNNMVTLRSDGISKVLSGTTTIEEVFRVTQQ